MKQMSFDDAEYAVKNKRTRREIFLAEMDQVVPWHVLLMEIEPFYPVADPGRRPYPIQTMLLKQNWFGLSDPAMEEALYEIVSMRLSNDTQIYALRRQPDLRTSGSVMDQLWVVASVASRSLSR